MINDRAELTPEKQGLELKEYQHTTPSKLNTLYSNAKKKFLLVVEWTVMLCDSHMTELKQTKRHNRRTKPLLMYFPQTILNIYVHIKLKIPPCIKFNTYAQ